MLIKVTSQSVVQCPQDLSRRSVKMLGFSYILQTAHLSRLNVKADKVI